jgi:hypothetical protein
MTMTNAERQARFRFRQKTQGHFKSEGTPMERLDAWVSSDAAHGLRIMAELNKTTAQEELDKLILAAVAAKKQEIGQQTWSSTSLAILDKRSVTR